MASRKRLTVVGAGVSGLTCGLRLIEAGHVVTILAKEPPLATVSAVAAAIWYPYLAAPRERVARWAAATFAAFEALADAPATGVVMCPGREGLRGPGLPPEWGDMVRGFREVTGETLTPGWTRAYAFTVPVIEMTVYLGWLLARFEARGGTLHLGAVPSLEAAGHGVDAVVNCAGLGARELARDDTVHPIRGQVVRVAQADVREFLLDDHDPRGVTYVIPRAHDVILGGTAEPHADGLAVDVEVAEAILTRCRELEPKLAHSPVLEHKVGLRPGRPTVRLEVERLATGGIIIHNYGHGGAGVTLSWGCADEVTALVREHVGESQA